MRSDSLATTIVIAAARTASPASWPPMRRESSGRAEDTWVTLVGFRSCEPAARDGEGDVGCGVTVGNRPARFDGVIVEPAIGASVTGGRVGTGAGGGAGLPGCPTDVITEAPAGESEVALTDTAKVIGAPGVALALILSVTFSLTA